MTNFTPDMIDKAKTANSPEELLELAKAEQVELTAEEAAAYFEMLSPKMGELDDNDLENVSGGGCKTKVGGKKYTIVTAAKKCFTGQFESNYYYDLGGREYSKNNSDKGLRDLWWKNVLHTIGECGGCMYLEFKGGTGYCSKS